MRDFGADLASLVLFTGYIHAIRCLIIGMYSDHSKLCRCGVPAVHPSTTGRNDDPREFRHLSVEAGAYAFPLCSGRSSYMHVSQSSLRLFRLCWFDMVKESAGSRGLLHNQDSVNRSICTPYMRFITIPWSLKRNIVSRAM